MHEMVLLCHRLEREHFRDHGTHTYATNIAFLQSYTPTYTCAEQPEIRDKTQTDRMALIFFGYITKHVFCLEHLPRNFYLSQTIIFM